MFTCFRRKKDPSSNADVLTLQSIYLWWFFFPFCSLSFVLFSFLQAILTLSNIYYCKKQIDASFLSPTARGSTTLWQCYDFILSSIRGQTTKNWRQFVKLMAWKNCEYHQVWLLQAILIFCLNDKNSKLIHLHTLGSLRKQPTFGDATTGFPPNHV